MKLTDILSRLNGVEADHDGHLAFCPAHNDQRTPSLKLTLKADGQLLVKCRAGCELDDVLAKINVPKSALFNVDAQGTRTIPARAPETVGPAEIAGLRVFVDETANLLPSSPAALDYLWDRFGITAETADDLDIGFADAGAHRRPWLSKAFCRYPRIVVPLADFAGVVRGAQGRDIGGKCPTRWISLTNVDGRTWGKYGVLSAGTGHNTVIITEGPSDGLTAVGAGYEALVIRGAGLASNAGLIDELVTGLAGRDVVLAGDPDSAGERFHKALSEALTAAGISVRKLSFPNEGEDLTEWRERDPDVFPDEFHHAVRTAAVVETRKEVPNVSASNPMDDAPSSELDTMSASDLEIFSSTDVGLAMMLRDFMTERGGGVRYAPGLGFLTWDGKVWQVGDGEVIHSLHLFGATLIASGDPLKRKIAIRALSDTAIKKTISQLQHVPGVPARAMDFDKQHHLLTVNNGTVDLRTGELRPHSSDDMLTKMVDFEYHPDAQAPRWDRFLTEIFPNHPELPSYMRRMVGYGITGSTSEQCFVFMHGSGANGKSKFLEALSHVFAGITKATEFSTFEQRTAVGQANPELASLRSARLVTASETEKYSRLAEALVKQLTGGDPVTTRQLYGTPFTYVPNFLLMVAGNYKPAILSQDHGVWRRVKLIPFEATFRGSDVDPELPATLRSEAEGILAWAVRGAQEWYRDGLGEPSSVSAATQEYKESEDRLGEFLASCTVREPGAKTPPMALRRAYAEWAEDAALSRKETLSGWSLGIEVDARGFKKRGRFFTGIRLMTDTEKARAARVADGTEDNDQAPADGADIFGQERSAA